MIGIAPLSHISIPIQSCPCYTLYKYIYSFRAGATISKSCHLKVRNSKRLNILYWKPIRNDKFFISWVVSRYCYQKNSYFEYEQMSSSPICHTILYMCLVRFYAYWILCHSFCAQTTTREGRKRKISWRSVRRTCPPHTPARLPTD